MKVIINILAYLLILLFLVIYFPLGVIFSLVKMRM